MQIPQAVIDEVIGRAEIVDVIGKYLKIKRSGQNYFACCPFHHEKSPSFSISPSKQMFHCFGCGESGNALSFIMKHQGLDFVTAVKSLADQYNVMVPEASQQNNLTLEQRQQHKQHKLDIHQTMRVTVNYYRQQLMSTKAAQAYLLKRGLTISIIQHFELGYAAAGFQNLQQLITNYATNQLLVDCGLVIDNTSGRRYDRFRERIIFPIKNNRGEVIAFGGRIIGSGEPKYLNSPETKLFNKSLELYGLFEAQKSIRELKQVIVVEGYLDVIALHQYGISNVVATMGTAISEEHIKTLFRLSEQIIYAFDGDSAGKKAAWRALERSIPLVSDIKAVNFLFLPTNHDPDSFIRHYGVDEFKSKIRGHMVGLLDFLLVQLAAEVQLNSAAGKARLISLTKPYLEQIKAAALQVILKQQLANLVGMAPQVVEKILNNRGKYAFFDGVNRLKTANLPLDVNIIMPVVRALLFNPHLAREFPLPELAHIETLTPDLQRLVALISYLEVNCDEFSDIDLALITAEIKFECLDLARLYAKVAEERQQFSMPFSLAAADYQKILAKLIYGKKRKLPPKLV